MTESANATQAGGNAGNSGLTLGQQLKNAREALNLSIADVALKTNLKKSHIESLENDIFILKDVAPAFVRGYVRGYVKFLRLPEALISSVNYGEVTIPKEVMTKLAPVKPASTFQGRSLKYLTVIVLLAALGMTLIWWWQGYRQEQANRDQFVNAAPAATENSAVAGNNTAEVALQPPLQSETQPVAASESAISANAAIPPVATAAADSGDILPMTAETETQAAAVNAELRIEITGSQSWVTVRDGKNKRLAERLYNNGEILTFNDNGQYRLTIGAPANVKLYYKGQEVPLKIDGRVARIRLPLAQ